MATWSRPLSYQPLAPLLLRCRHERANEVAGRLTVFAKQDVFVKISSEQVAVLVGRGIDAAGSLVFLKMLSTLADKSDVGKYMLASSYLALVLVISFSALDQGLLRNVTEYRKQSSLASRYSAMLVMYLCLAAIVSGSCAITLSVFDLDAALRGILVPLSLWLAFEAVKNLNMTVASGLRSRSLIAGASAVDYGFRLALLWIMHSAGIVSTENIVYLLAAAGMAASGVFLWGQRQLLSRFSWSDVRHTLVDSIKFSWPMIIWGMFGWLQNMSNRWLLSHFADLSVVAEYGVLVAIGTFPVTALLGLVVTYVVPILYERESSEVGSSRAIVRRVALALIPVGALLVFMVTIWHRELTTLLSGKSYVVHSHVLPLIMAAASTSAICSVLTYAVFAQRRVASLLLANTVPGLFSLAFGYFAVSRYQFNGAILTLVVSHLLAATLFMVAFVLAKNRPVL
jgi:O-antigen/teichoic acid export membrane protein